MDLKHVFCQVRSQFLRNKLLLYNITDCIFGLNICSYSNFHFSFTSRKFKTNHIKADRRVLQSDCFSPLWFNLCITIFANTVRNKNTNRKIDDSFTHLG